MTPKERAIIQQALEALESKLGETHPFAHDLEKAAAIRTLREALAEPDIEEMTLTQIAARNEQTNEEVKITYYMLGFSDGKHYAHKYEQAEQEPVAWRVRGYNQFKTGNPGPWRYVDGADKPAVNNPDCCDFTPLYAAPVQQAEQEPVAKFLEDNLVVENERVGKSGHRVLEIREEELLRIMEIYAAPVRTKDLTDEEILKTNKTELPDCQDLVDFARAVIAADREKNK